MMGADEIKQAGLKVTLPRARILQILESAQKRHMSAEDVYRELLEDDESNIGLATVYRVLTQFEAAGLIIRHNFEGGQSVYEIDDGEHHDHMVCLKTGKIVEFHDEIIEQRQREIAAQHGFELADHSLILYGEFKS
ncbi:MAG: ferric iron uptake transcriptional regulator [Leucothrix sp.]